MTDLTTHYRPTTADLVRTVADFLTSIGPKLESGDRYTALVCKHILGMVERELLSGPLQPLNEADLAADIRAGAHDETWRRTFEAVLNRTIERVALVKPDHLAAIHRANR
ncbi:MAG: hypothetical protein WDN04_24580 [Rhodospirillales bacterium]